MWYEEHFQFEHIFFCKPGRSTPIPFMKKVSVLVNFISHFAFQKFQLHSTCCDYGSFTEECSIRETEYLQRVFKLHIPLVTFLTYNLQIIFIALQHSVPDFHDVSLLSFSFFLPLPSILQPCIVQTQMLT